MSESQERDEFQVLKAIRDELRVQAELGSMELRDQWQALEKRWHELEAHMGVAADGVREDADHVKSAGKALLEELRKGYENLRDRL